MSVEKAIVIRGEGVPARSAGCGKQASPLDLEVLSEAFNGGLGQHVGARYGGSVVQPRAQTFRTPPVGMHGTMPGGDTYAVERVGDGDSVGDVPR